MTDKEALATVLELAQVGEKTERTDKSMTMNSVKENIDAITQVDEIWETMGETSTLEVVNKN